MNESLTIQLPVELYKELDLISSKENITKNVIIEEALKSFLLTREFNNLREKMVQKAKDRGLFTDEDVFREVS